MKTLLALLAAAFVAWFGLKLYEQGELPWIQGSLESLLTPEQTKCITADGRVFYGKVPSDVRCERVERAEGSLAVVSGEDFNKLGTNGPAGAGGVGPPPSGFRCDGRTRCSQMTSCAEARFFLTNCPRMQMDGNNDGVPCERQWCN